MKICILTPRFPFPENGGDVLRINNIARYLKEQNHHLILISFTEKTPNLKQAYQLYDEIHCVQHHLFLAYIRSFFHLITGRPLQCGYYHSLRLKKMVNFVEQHITPDLYISHLLRMTPYLDNKRMRSKSIIEMTDALSKTYLLSTQSSMLSLKRLVYSIEFNLIKRYEQYVIKKFPKTVLVSQQDVQYLTANKANPAVVCLSNGVKSAEHPSSIYNPNKMCFVGNMRTLQNQDAAIFFVEEVLPIILRKNPKAVFYIVGDEPPAKIRQLACNPQVVITGFVNNVEDVISDACLCVAPIRIAAGIQNKVLIALGQGIPAILTPLIAKAIPELEDGVNCFIQSDRNHIANKCLQLMNDTELRKKLSIAGHQIANDCYRWENMLNSYEVINC